MEEHHLSYDGFLRSFENYKRGLQSILIGFAVVTIQSSLDKTVYTCPCDPQLRQLYAYLFIFVPLLMLIIVGIALSPKSWKQIQGCFKNDSLKCKKYCTGCCSFNCFKSCFAGFNKFWDYFRFSYVAASVWIVVVTLEGDFVACAVTPIAYKEVANKTCKPVSITCMHTFAFNIYT